MGGYVETAVLTVLLDIYRSSATNRHYRNGIYYMVRSAKTH
jgi:hypothetical protein